MPVFPRRQRREPLDAPSAHPEAANRLSKESLLRNPKLRLSHFAQHTAQHRWGAVQEELITWECSRRKSKMRADKEREASC